MDMETVDIILGYPWLEVPPVNVRLRAATIHTVRDINYIYTSVNIKELIKLCLGGRPSALMLFLWVQLL